MRHAAVFFGIFLTKNKKETQKMKNSLFLTSRGLLLLVALPALSLFG